MTDDDSGVGIASTTATVNNVAPVIESLNAPIIDEDGTATLTGSFTDLGSLDSHTVVVTWGDGTSSDATVDPETRTFTASRQYLNDNPTNTASDVYSLTVTDDDGGIDTDETTVTVNNVAPVVALNPVITINKDGVAMLTGTVTDPGTLDTFTLLVNWGEPLSPNNAQTVSLPASAIGTQSFTLTHRYLDDNPSTTPEDRYTISVTVTDDDTQSHSASTSDTVENTPPEIVSVTSSTTIDDRAVVSQTVTLTGSFTASLLSASPKSAKPPHLEACQLSNI